MANRLPRGPLTPARPRSCAGSATASSTRSSTTSSTARDGPPVRTGDAGRAARAARRPAARRARRPRRRARHRCSRDVLPFMQHGDHPRFFARVPSPSNPVGALGDALATGFNAFAGSWAGGSGPAALELVVLDWLRGWCGLPEETEGILVSGGSVGSLTALAAAREALPPGAAAWPTSRPDPRLGRCARCGCSASPDDAARARVRRRLPAAADACRGAGADRAPAAPRSSSPPPARRTPARSTRSPRSPTWRRRGALAARRRRLRRARRAHRARAAALLAGIERADSLVLDPHKWLFQPYEIGCVLVRRPGALRARVRDVPRVPARRRRAGDEVAFRDRGPQLTPRLARAEALAVAPGLRPRRVPRRRSTAGSTSPSGPRR